MCCTCSSWGRFSNFEFHTQSIQPTIFNVQPPRDRLYTQRVHSSHSVLVLMLSFQAVLTLTRIPGQKSLTYKHARTERVSYKIS